MIQVITYNKSKCKFTGESITVSQFDSPRSLDDFQINIIDLSDANIWQNYENTNSSLNCMKDIKSISKIILDSHEGTEIVVILPQNEHLRYSYYTYEKRYSNSILLKDMIPTLHRNILNELHLDLSKITLVFANTKTSIGDRSTNAAFYFKQAEHILTKSDVSEHATTIKLDRIIVTSLQLIDNDSLIKFLTVIGLIREDYSAPEWINNVVFYDDSKNKETIDKNYSTIRKAEEKIHEANEKLLTNNYYKSILYKHGQSLVNVVFEILEKIVNGQ